MSTLISELEEKPSLGDGDLVQNILKEMNGVGGLSPQQPHATMQPPPAGGASGVINAAMPNTALAPRVMDPGPATAHIIGGQHPTPGDFAAAMKGAGSLGGGPQPADSWGAGLAEYTPQARPAPAPKPVQKSWTRRILDEARTPLLVAMLVFLFSLPVVNFLFAHYIPWMVKASGELTAVGSLVKSLAAGITFWVLQRVVVPLLSL